MPLPEIRQDDDGNWHSAGAAVELSIIPDAAVARMFRRRAIKGAGTPRAHEVCWLVGELDGVRLYCDGTRLVMTKRDILP